MCVLKEALPSAPVAAADQLVETYFPIAPGTLAQFDAGTTVLVTGCGDGGTVLELARRFPRSLFAGIDDSDWNIAGARRDALAAGAANVWFEAGNITTHCFGGIFHVIASLEENSSAPVLAQLTALHRSLRRHGTLFFQPPASTVSQRLLDAGFAHVRSVTFASEPDRPLYIARR